MYYFEKVFIGEVIVYAVYDICRGEHSLFCEHHLELNRTKHLL